MLEKIFKLKEKGTTVKTEVLAGVTTFLAMAYILAVNPQMLGETGMSIQGVFLATAISSAVATIIMGCLLYTSRCVQETDILFLYQLFQNNEIILL